MKQIHGIKRADNGTIGESRTKAFLIDRFWILERSVDMEGADFIIQRKLHSQSILSETPPRFGIVQSKFSQDKNTSHRVKKEYVVDSDGKPHIEFFLIINIGYEDSQKMCLLSAEDIADKCRLNDSNQYEIKTKELIIEFEVKNRKRSLDFMEKSIQYVEFYKNRMYIFNELSRVSPDLEAIDPNFTFDIDYIDGTIPDIFSEQRRKAYDFIVQIEEMHHHLVSFIQETNPIESCYIAESFNRQYDKLSIPEIFSKDFYFKTINYREQIDNLRKDGILNTFLSLRRSIRDNVNSFLRDYINEVNEDSLHIISIKYDIFTLNELVLNNEILSEPNPESKYLEFREVKEGDFKTVIAIGKNLRNGAIVPIINEVCLNEIVQKIYSLKYFEDNNET